MSRLHTSGAVSLLRLLKNLPLSLFAFLVTAFVTLNALPALSAIASRDLITRARSAGTHPGAWHAVVTSVAVFALAMLVQQLAVLAIDPIAHAASRHIDGRLRYQVAELALSPTQTVHLDRADLMGTFALASSDMQGYTPGRAAVSYLGQLCQLAGCLACLGLLAPSQPWLVVACLVVLLTRRWSQKRIYVDLNWLVVRSAALTRRHRFWAQFASSVQNAKEIRVFGLGDWVTDRHRTAFLAQTQPIWEQRRRKFSENWRSLLAGIVAMFLGLSAIASGSASHDPGTVAQDVSALLAAMWLGSLGYGSFDVEHGMPMAQAADQLRRERNRIGESSPAVPPPRDRTKTPPTVRFHELSFSYPGSGQPVLNGLDLEVRAGEVLAIVGVNGAGKTTTTKLLTRALAPGAGRITVGGQDLADLPAAHWRSQIAVVTQEFLRLDLSVRQNIEIGAPEHAGDDAFFEQVVDDLDLDDLVSSLPQSWDSPLSRKLSGGSELSGGQWQRIALARAVFALRAGRTLLILDEPTAHLDAEAEGRIFNRLIAAARGATVILISHRLATVRLADRIALLQDGRIQELGTHEELLTERRIYAELFELQSQQFAAVTPVQEGKQ
ncbi:ATP-binding cassette domain-containing protein [Streptomyces sp. NPDC059697]|uniref:ATP-binding cassette domain-containing protein n=1 Tax=Streptomyces sp. NPDC059697 TaxID=3346912 RepID=UPI0036919E0C